jgi:hypothetical protein
MTTPPTYPGTPRWVKVFGIVALILVALFAIAHLSGHGFHHHGSEGHGDHTAATDAR